MTRTLLTFRWSQAELDYSVSHRPMRCYVCLAGILVVALAGLACRMSVPWMPAALMMEEKIDGHKDISECMKTLPQDDSIFEHDPIPAPGTFQSLPIPRKL